MKKKHPDFVQKMIDEPGLYAVINPDHPNIMVPVFSVNGELYSMVPDKILTPEGFREGLELRGPILFPCQDPKTES